MTFLHKDEHDTQCIPWKIVSVGQALGSVGFVFCSSLRVSDITLCDAMVPASCTHTHVDLTPCVVVAESGGEPGGV